MAIDVRRFVDVNIKPHLTSAVKGTRKTVILYTGEIATNPDSTFPKILESKSEAFTYCAGMTNTLIYLDIFFTLGGASVKVINGVAKEDIVNIDVSDLSNDEIIIAYAGASTDISTIYANMKSLAIANQPVDEINPDNDLTNQICGINEKIFLARCISNSDADSVENFAVKYSNVHGAEMAIAAFLSRINVYGTNTVYDYMFTEEGWYNDSFESWTGIAPETLSDTQYQQTLENNFNVNVYFAGASRNCGGNLKDGQDLVNKYVLIILHQTLTERLLDLLTQRLKNSIGLTKIYSVMADELANYVTDGYLTTDKIWTDEPLTVTYNNQTFTIIEKGTALINGYLIRVLPYYSLTAADKQAHKTPPIYVIIGDQYGIRSIQVRGEVI